MQLRCFCRCKACNKKIIVPPCISVWMLGNRERLKFKYKKQKTAAVFAFVLKTKCCGSFYFVIFLQL